MSRVLVHEAVHDAFVAKIKVRNLLTKRTKMPSIWQRCPAFDKEDKDAKPIRQAAVETQQKLGNGMEAGVTQGPLINKSQHRWTLKYKNYMLTARDVLDNIQLTATFRRKPSLRCPPPAKCVQWWRRQKQKVPRWWLEEKRARCTENYIISEALKEIILWENTCYILFCRPTILTGVTPDMQLCQEEIFGPVVSIQKFSEEKVCVLFYRPSDKLSF